MGKLFGILKKVGIGIVGVFLVLFVVGLILDDTPSQADAEAAGFSSGEEFKQYKQAGFATKTEFEKTGFQTLDEYSEYATAGFSTKQEFVESGFSSIQQARSLSKYGKTLDEAVSSASEITFDEFQTCDKKGGTFYKNECQGKMVVWYGSVRRHSSDGVNLDVGESCQGISSKKNNVDAPNLSFDFWKENDGRCIQFMARVGAENFSTPDVSVEEVLWVETEQQKIDRVAKAEAVKAAEKKAAEEQALKDLEKNKTNAEWLSDKFQIAAGVRCRPVIESLAKNTYRWIDGMLETKFSSYLTSVSEPYVLTVSGDKVEFQNGFGAWVRQDYYCAYNVKTQKVVNAWVR